MTGSKCLIDTSIAIHYFKNNKEVAKKLDRFLGLFICTTVIGELYFGAYASINPSKYINIIELLLLLCIILNNNDKVSQNYGKIKATLKQKGKPIPENDIWIASAALNNNLPLFSTDNHFSEIEDLILL